MILSTFLLSSVLYILVHGASICNVCSDEGACFSTNSSDTYLICASTCLLTMPAGNFACVSGTLLPCQSQTSSTVQSAATSSSHLSKTSLDSSISSNYTDSTTSAVSIARTNILQSPIATRTEVLLGPTLISGAHKAGAAQVQSVDSWGIRSYVKNGTMASVYDASASSTFRCSDVKYPSDGLYVAFWTPFEEDLYASRQSQPAPMNCGDYIEFANPLTGHTATALVLDRCASCVGVGYSLGDPTTSDSLANGATVDLSRALWNALYDDAPDNVYDVIYQGRPLQGTDSFPKALDS